MPFLPDSIRNSKLIQFFEAGEVSNEITLEASGNVSESTSMKINIIGDKFIEKNIKLHEMQPVTNPNRFEKGNIPTADGLFSPYIFGFSEEEKRRTFSYIDLHCKVFHPYVYEIIKRTWNKIDTIAAGQSSWVVNADGTLSEDPEGDPDNTGMDWLVKNFRKIKFKQTGSHIRDERMKLLDSLRDDEIFISKWLVIPLFFRDVQIVGGVQNIPPLNKNYTNIIRYANSVERDPYFSNVAKFNIQMELIAIRQYGQSLVEKKRGFFKRNVLGKTTDYGYRSVISVMYLDQADKPDQHGVDLLHTGVPLSQCLVIFFPFIRRYVTEFFRQQFESNGDRSPILNSKGEIEYVEINDPLAHYTADEIQKIIDQYVDTPAVRFRPIMIPTKEYGDRPLYFTGASQNQNRSSIKADGIATRYMTWTDLFYLAAIEMLSDKHVYITRYPLVDYFGIVPNRIFVLSTVRTAPMIINDKVYEYYPVVDPSLPEDAVRTLFNDTITMDNHYLKGLGGDYDGDQVSIRGVFTQEANAEAERILSSPKHYVDTAGGMMREIGNEAFLTYYNMTVD